MPTASQFQLKAPFSPAGDQPAAIAALLAGITAEQQNQTLLGVTGSGKTFTMAHVIQNSARPALVLAHNKTLAAQLYGEMKAFFPDNAVEYFVSYYDYYQPEAYVPRSDTFIEKESSINEQISRMRHAATRALLEREDAIVVASVSCIYGIGSPENYADMVTTVKVGDEIPIREFRANLVEIHYERNDVDFHRGCFRLRGDTLELFPAHLDDQAWRFSFFGDEIEEITVFDPLTGERFEDLDEVKIYANSHYVTPQVQLKGAMEGIKVEMKERVAWFRKENRLLEAQRLEQRTKFDLEMIAATGTCNGIENYSRYLTGRQPGQAPPTLFEYLPDNAMLFVDESHVMIPQLRAMYKGDRSRKSTLAEHGFRLPSCMDNRPLKFEEWDSLRPQTVFISATPGPWELQQCGGRFIEQVVRPTGLIDPVIEIRPTDTQVDDLMHEARRVSREGGRVLVTTLTKRMAENLTEYLNENGLKVRYMHSDIDTLERIEILQGLRMGEFEVLVGINLLREGLDIPECMCVAILDADKAGFLRSETSLIQTIGRAARNVDGLAVLYADKITPQMQAAIDETERRRAKQIAHNEANGITPKTIKKAMRNIIADVYGKQGADGKAPNAKGDDTPRTSANIRKLISKLENDMKEAAGNLEFETAARLRDEIKRLEGLELGLKGIGK